MEQNTLSKREQAALHTLLPHLNELLRTVASDLRPFTNPLDERLLSAVESSKGGKIIRKKFGECMVIFTFMDIHDGEENILRVFCSLDKDGEFVRIHYNFISKEQAALIKEA